MENGDQWIEKQLQLCKKLKVPHTLVADDMIIGVAMISLSQKDEAVHGLRHPGDAGTSGWYLWKGGFSNDDNFFEPVHLSHLAALMPEAIKFLGLPPGWRFLKHFQYEDIWFDELLLATES